MINMAQIVFHRPKNERYYSEGKLKVVVDNVVIGKIVQGETITYETNHGAHTVKARTVLGMGSKPIILDVQNQEKVEIILNPDFNFSPYQAFGSLPLLLLIILNNHHFWIRITVGLLMLGVIAFFIRMLIKGRTEAVIIRSTNS